MKYEHPKPNKKMQMLLVIHMWDPDLCVQLEFGITSLRIPSTDSGMTNEQLVQPSVFKQRF